MPVATVAVHPRDVQQLVDSLRHLVPLRPSSLLGGFPRTLGFSRLTGSILMRRSLWVLAAVVAVTVAVLRSRRGWATW